MKTIKLRIARLILAHRLAAGIAFWQGVLDRAADPALRHLARDELHLLARHRELLHARAAPQLHAASRLRGCFTTPAAAETWRTRHHRTLAQRLDSLTPNAPASLRPLIRKCRDELL